MQDLLTGKTYSLSYCLMPQSNVMQLNVFNASNSAIRFFAMTKMALHVRIPRIFYQTRNFFYQTRNLTVGVQFLTSALFQKCPYAYHIFWRYS